MFPLIVKLLQPYHRRRVKYVAKNDHQLNVPLRRRRKKRQPMVVQRRDGRQRANAGHSDIALIIPYILHSIPFINKKNAPVQRGRLLFFG